MAAGPGAARRVGGRVGGRIRGACVAVHVQDEVEGALLAAAGAADVHQQGRVEDCVRAVAGLAGEVELGGQHGLAGGLCLDVDVPGAAGIEAGHDRLQGERTGGVAELVAAEGVPGHVVVAVVVGLPEVEEHAGQRDAVPAEDVAADGQRGAPGAGGDQVGAQRGARLEVRALHLVGRQVVAVVAVRGRRQAPVVGGAGGVPGQRDTAGGEQRNGGTGGDGRPEQRLAADPAVGAGTRAGAGPGPGSGLLGGGGGVGGHGGSSVSSVGGPWGRCAGTCVIRDVGDRERARRRGAGCLVRRARSVVIAGHRRRAGRGGGTPCFAPCPALCGRRTGPVYGRCRRGYGRGAPARRGARVRRAGTARHGTARRGAAQGHGRVRGGRPG
ncbi:hypothetical protein STENM36S_01018 [Streptomyces tendae]